MKMVTLQVPEQRPDGIPERVYTAAKKKGDITVSASTATENLRLGKGLYEVKPDPLPEVTLVGMKQPEEMTSEELALEASAHGKPFRKKVSRSAAIEHVQTLRAESIKFIMDDDEE